MVYYVIKQDEGANQQDESQQDSQQNTAEESQDAPKDEDEEKAPEDEPAEKAETEEQANTVEQGTDGPAAQLEKEEDQATQGKLGAIHVH